MGVGGGWLHVHQKHFFVTIISFWHNTIFHQFSTDVFFYSNIFVKAFDQERKCSCKELTLLQSLETCSH